MTDSSEAKTGAAQESQEDEGEVDRSAPAAPIRQARSEEPAAHISRHSHRPLEVKDCQFPAGQALLILLAAYLAIAGSMAFTPHGLWPDEAFYMGASRNFFAGKGLVLGVEGGVFPALPIVSGALSLFTGFSKAPFYTGTLLAGCSAILATFFLAKRLLGGSGPFALMAASLVAANSIFLFYSARILLDVYDAAAIALGLLALVAWMDSPGSVAKGALFGVAAALAYFVRVPNAIVLCAAALAAIASVLMDSRKGPFPIKSIAAGAAALCLPVAAWILLSAGSVMGFYSVVDRALVEKTVLPNIPNMLQSLQYFFGGPAAVQTLGPFFGGWLLLILVALGLFALPSRREIAPLATVLIVGPLTRLPGVPYDARYLLSILPVCAILFVALLHWAAGRALDSLKAPSWARMAGPLAIVCVFCLLSIPAGTALFNSKKGGYLEIEYSAQWIGQNTEAGDVVFAGAHRIVGLFSARDVRPMPATADDLFRELDSTRATYLEIDNYDWAQPKYALSLPSDYPTRFFVEKQFINPEATGGSLVLRYLGKGA